MKKIIQLGLSLSLCLASAFSLAQTLVATPSGTVITSPQSDSRAIGWSGGKTWQFSNASWQAFTSPCVTFGYPDVITGVINGYNTAPPNSTCAGMSNLSYDGANSNLNAGVVVYSGTTTYFDVFYGGHTVPVRLTFHYTNASSVAIPVISSNGYKFIKVTQNFNVNAEIDAFSPNPGAYIFGGPNVWTPAITLFDELSTNPSSSICTSLNQGSFITFSVSPSASSTSPYCVGQTIVLNSSATAQIPGALTYAWTGPLSYSNGSQNTSIANSTTAMSGTYTVSVTDAIGCIASATVPVLVNPKFNVVSSAGANGTISPLGTTAICLGGSQLYTITPSGGFHILDVLVDGVSNAGAIAGGTYTFTNVLAAHTISVTFAPNCIAPTFTTCPGTQTSNTAFGICSNTVSYTIATAGTSPIVNYSFSGATTGSGSGTGSGSSFNRGTTSVTLTATNGCGTVNCNFNVVISDNINPTITAPTALSTTTNTACTATGVSLGTPVTADNCSVASVTNDHASTTYPLGATTVIWTVTDGSGNTATAAQVVTVTDNVMPTIAAPAAVSATTNTACTATGVSLGTPTTADNCSVASVTNDHASTTYPLGATTVIWTVTDGSGNTATAAQVVTVTDNVMPTIAAPAAVSATTNTACTATGVSLGTPTTADNCSVASVTNDHASTTYPLGATTVTWTVTDGSGNTATATQLVTVTDNMMPTITAPAAVSATTNTACTATGVSLGTPTTADNCTVASATNNAPSAFPIGNTTVTWTVTDGSGNTATATQLVTVFDTEVPTITAPADVTVCSGAAVSLGTPTTADNCTVASTTSNAPGSYGVGTTVVTWTVTDGSGNTATANQNVIVNPLPIGSASNIVICNGDPSNLPLSADITGTTFTWTSSVTTGGVIGNGSCPSGCASTISDVLTNTGFVHGVVEYTVTPTSADGCVGADFTATVTVGAAPAMPVISGPSVVCNVTTTTYSVATVPEATAYIWTVPTGVTGMTITSGQGTNSITVNISAGTVTGNVTCTASNNCGSSTAASMAVTKKPAQPGAISGPTSTCGQTTASYSIASVFGATSYAWQVPAGMTITAGQGTTAITVSMTPSFVYGQVKVSAVNNCGNVPAQALNVTGNVPGTPVTLSGPTNVCGLSSATYSIAPVNGATGYNWTITGAGTIIGSNTGTSVTVALNGTTGGSVSCAATNVCGNGIARTLNLVVTAIQPGLISGPITVCGVNTATYTVASVGAGYTYNWSLSLGSGWSITSGQGTNSITISGTSVSTNPLSGLVKVTSTNGCGSTSAFRTLAVTYCHDGIAMNNGVESNNTTFSNIYPNPTSSEFTIDVVSAGSTTENQEVTVEVYDVLGNLVINAKHQLVSGTNTMKTNIEDFENGMYFVRLLDGDLNVIHSQTVIKQ